MNQIAEKSFYYLSEDELKKMQEAAEVPAPQERLAIRRKRSKKGRFDIATLRNNLIAAGCRWAGFERRKKERPRCHPCDVSTSVRNASRFMLRSLIHCRSRLRVRSFIFVSDIGRLPNIFATTTSKMR